MKVELSAEADGDIRALIRQGLDRFGPSQVEAYLDGLEDVFGLIAAFPAIGTERGEFALAYRSYPYKAHTIFYRVAADRVLIVRIRHAREDWQEGAF